MRRIVTLSIALLLLVGCSSRAPKGTVSGTITYKGDPVNGATLLLYPSSAEGSEFTIPVSQEGIFRSGDVPAGEYKVVVQASAGNPGPSTKGMSPAQLAEMKDRIEKMKVPATIKYPDKYKDKKKTDLTMSVAKGEQKVDLDLKD